MSAVIIRLSDYRRPKPDPISESLAAFRLSTLRTERLAEELEQLEREIADMLRDNPKVSL